MSLCLKAHAKINLGLRILSKRPDGYHELITVFQRISLADEVILEKLNNRIEYEGPTLTNCPEDNLCYRAARAFRSSFGSDLGVRITLEKIIPPGAGLGGGSSDAAAVLRGMAELYNVPKDHKALLSAAEEIGSDIPFFLSDSAAALGRGKGERIQSVNGLDSTFEIVILKPDFDVSTAWAYSQLDDILTFEEKSINITAHDFLVYAGGFPTAQMTNDFEGLLFNIHPELDKARSRMLNAGAEFSGLCGSGSAIFGVFKNHASAKKVASEFCSPWFSYVCRPC